MKLIRVKKITQDGVTLVFDQPVTLFKYPGAPGSVECWLSWQMIADLAAGVHVDRLTTGIDVEIPKDDPARP